MHRAEGKHKARRNDRQLYKMAENACQNFMMAVVDKTWYKEIEDPDTLYTKVTALKLLDHLTEFCAVLHTVNAVNIPQLVKSLYKDSEGVPQFINAMEAAQRKSKRSKLVINDEYMHDVLLKSLLQSGEYETETRYWSKLPEDKQTWADWKTTFRAAYVVKRQSEAAREGEQNPFGGSAPFGVAPVEKEQHKQEEAPQMSHQMLDPLEGYLDNIAAAATQTAANGGPLSELAAILAVSVDTVARQQIEIRRITYHIHTLKNKVGVVTAGVPGPGGTNSNYPHCKHCTAVGRSAPHRNNKCYFDPRKNKERMGWGKWLMEAKGIVFNN